MGIYRDLARTPGVFRVLFSQLTAKLPFGMLSITILLHIELAYGNFTSAGIILAAQSVGQAISGPISSRLMGRLGMRRVLIVTTVICSSLLVVIALVMLPLAVVAVTAFIIGLTTPPVTPAVRTIYPKLVPGNRVSALFSLDASAQEVIWVIGPVVAVFISTQISTVWGLLLAAAFMFGGGFWFILSRPVGQVRLTPSRRRLGAVLSNPTVIVSTIIGFLFVASFAALEVGVVGEFGHDGIEAGIILAIYSIGSVTGGLLIGHRELTPWSLFVRLTVVLAGTALCLISMHPVWLSVALFIGGFGVAPTFAALFTAVSSTTKLSETAEAFGWVATGHLVGVALGSAVAGVAIDLSGGYGGVIISVGFLIVTVIASLVCVRWLPDLRGKDAAPPPDTAPIQLPAHKA